MPAKQRMRLANEKHSQNVHTRGNVPKTLVSVEFVTVSFSNDVDAVSFMFHLQCDIYRFLTLSFSFCRNHKMKNTQLDQPYSHYLSSLFVDQVK